MLPLGLIFLAGSAGDGRGADRGRSRSPARSRRCAGGSWTATARARLTGFALACALATWALVIAHAAGAPHRRRWWRWRAAGRGWSPRRWGRSPARSTGHALRERRRPAAARLRARLGRRGGGGDLRAAARRARRRACSRPRRRSRSPARRCSPAPPPTARTTLAPRRRARGRRRAAGRRCPAALWLLFAALALHRGLARRDRHRGPGGRARAGPRQRGGRPAGRDGGRQPWPAASLAGRRRWRWPPHWRVVALLALMAAGSPCAATATGPARTLLGAALLVPGRRARRALRDALPARRPLAPARIGDSDLRVAGHGQQRRAGARRGAGGGA